jgi:crotonobetainyl-CoA:carnitine CoA-transferase CaiB-like acyl-CoA transferase
MAAPLEGIRVLELGRVLAAPFCGQMLGDLGADVIKIEMAGVGDESRAYGPPFVDGQSFYFLSLNRNKESVTLNLKDERGKDILRKLIARADVFVHNSVPGPMERLGFSYDAVRKINPRIIYCGISGYGQSGPDRDKPSLDMMAQALSGIMFLTGEPDGAPMRSGAAISDISAGMFAAYAIVAALYHRDRTGEGQMVDTSLLESSVSLLTYQASRYFVTGENPTRLGNAHPSIVPYDCYRTADGWVTVAIMNQPMWERFCKALDLEDLTCDPRFHTNPERVQNRDALREILYERMGSLPTADVIARFNSANVPCAEVRDLHAVFADPQAQHVGLRQTISHAATGDIDVVAPAFHLSASPTTLRKPPPRLGEHNEKILGELGLRSQEIEALRSDGVI